VKFEKTYETPRHLAVAAGLAQFTRGRMGKPAMALIAEARTSGVTFDNETNPPEPSKPRGENVAVKSTRTGVPEVVITDAMRDGFRYARKPSSTEIRLPTSYKGKTVEGYTVGWSSCSRCTQYSTYCACPGGPKPPSIVVEITESTILTDALD